MIAVPIGAAAQSSDLEIDPQTGLPRIGAPTQTVPIPAEPGRALTGRELAARERALGQGETLEPVGPGDGEAEGGAETRPEGAPADGGEPAASETFRLDRGAPIPEAPPAPSEPGVRVVMRGLDKLTGELGETDADVGGSASLWRLQIDVKSCYRRPEAGSTDASAFLQVYDTKYDPPEPVFSGWMFAASPALSAMDHPRYDIWVLSCSNS